MEKVKLNKKLYKLSTIKKAMGAYSHLADMSLADEDKYYKINFKKIEPEYKGIITDEFINYVLIRMKK